MYTIHRALAVDERILAPGGRFTCGIQAAPEKILSL